MTPLSIATITVADAQGGSITSTTRFVPVTERIPPAKISKRNWKRLPAQVQQYSKESVEQTLGVVAFHERLHANNTPHWIERREDGTYLLWGEDASNVAFMPGFSMDDFPVGTRIAG
jgi:hypothetical protein